MRALGATVVLSLALAGIAAPDPALAEAPGEPEVVEQIDEVELVEVVQAVHVSPAGASAGHSLASTYGRLHPAFVHLPIGFLALLLVFELANLFRPREEAARCSMLALAAAVLAALPSVASGVIRTMEMWPTAPPPEALADHRLLMLLASALLVVALVLRLARRNRLSGAPRLAYLVIIAIAFGVAAVGAHMGGRPAFGEHHLPF